VNKEKYLRIALIQQKNTLDRERNLARGLDALDRAASAGAGLIVFPELSFLPFLPQQPAGPVFKDWAETVPGSTTDLISRKAAERRVLIIFNLLEIHEGKTYDSSPVIDRDGQLAGLNRMVHVMEASSFMKRLLSSRRPGGRCLWKLQLAG